MHMHMHMHVRTCMHLVQSYAWRDLKKNRAPRAMHASNPPTEPASNAERRFSESSLNSNDEDKCSICLETRPLKFTVTGCNHAFCTPCIKDSVVKYGNRQCPLCRAVITTTTEESVIRQGQSRPMASVDDDESSEEAEGSEEAEEEVVVEEEEEEEESEEVMCGVESVANEGGSPVRLSPIRHTLCVGTASEPHLGPIGHTVCRHYASEPANLPIYQGSDTSSNESAGLRFAPDEQDSEEDDRQTLMNIS